MKIDYHELSRDEKAIVLYVAYINIADEIADREHNPQPTFNDKVILELLENKAKVIHDIIHGSGYPCPNDFDWGAEAKPILNEDTGPRLGQMGQGDINKFWNIWKGDFNNLEGFELNSDIDGPDTSQEPKSDSEGVLDLIVKAKKAQLIHQSAIRLLTGMMSQADYSKETMNTQIDIAIKYSEALIDKLQIQFRDL